MAKRISIFFETFTGFLERVLKCLKDPSSAMREKDEDTLRKLLRPHAFGHRYYILTRGDILAKCHSTAEGEIDCCHIV